MYQCKTKRHLSKTGLQVISRYLHKDALVELREMCRFITKDEILKCMSEKSRAWMSKISIFTYHYEHLHGSRQHEYWIFMPAKQLRVRHKTNSSQFNE